jgi:hypothetical protein
MREFREGDEGTREIEERRIEMIFSYIFDY